MGRKKIGDPLGEGLVSRIYLAAFPQPRSSYEIARLVVRGESINSSGRILKVAEKFPDLFFLREERVSRHKMRTLIFSNMEPFLLRLSEECGLSSEEANILRGFEANFRKLVGIYLDLTLKHMDPEYLRGNVNAFEDLSTALRLTLYIARLYSSARPQAAEFTFSLMNKTLPVVLDATGISNKEIHEIARNIADMAQQQTLRLYDKIRKTPISSYYKGLFMMLEGFEKYYQALEKSLSPGKDH